jgi:hypothetical protein
MKTQAHKFSPIIWCLLAGSLMSRLGIAMTIPFMSFFLHQKLGISLAYTGLIIGSSTLAYALPH